MTPLQSIFLLIGSGIVLLLAELFLPTHGLLGIAGVFAILAAVGKTFFINEWAGLGLLLATTVSVPFAWTAAMKLWPKTPIGRQMVLPSIEAIPDPPAVYLGQTGITLSELRPMGVCDFAGLTVEATSEIGMIEAGRTVTVTSLKNRRPLVRAV